MNAPQSDKAKFKEAFNERLMQLSLNTLHLADMLRKNPTLWPVSDQVVRSATSIGANVHEARGASSKRDYAHFFSIALKSAHETAFWLTMIMRYDTTFREQIQPMEKENGEIIKALQSAVLTMQGKKRDIQQS
jgi:four helix bundle protein